MIGANTKYRKTITALSSNMPRVNNQQARFLRCAANKVRTLSIVSDRSCFSIAACLFSIFVRQIPNGHKKFLMRNTQRTLLSAGDDPETT